MKFFGWVREKAGSLYKSARQRLAEPLSLKAKLLILSLGAIVVVGGGYIAYLFYDFTQNNPKFCVSCHLMQPAYDTWAASEHKSLNCHDCHYLSIPEQNMLLINFVLHRPDKVPERHGKIIVSSKICNQCHTEGNAKRINRSLFHAKHVYMEQIECTVCHGEVKPDKSGLHSFLPTEKFCTKCHADKVVHGEGMGGLACLNCHTDRTKDLRPERKKCLFCHSTDESIRKELIEDGTMDVRYFIPDQDIIKKAVKIKYTEQSPMQFYCYECHKPHTAAGVRPRTESCLKCHPAVRNVGKHRIHLNIDMQCKDCHKPHLWKVTESSARKDCVKCHEYKNPQSFL